MTQKEALEILKTGQSAFITGAAGSGKTHLLNQYISWLTSEGIPVAVTASTGIAATHMGGMTIHSWSGIGIRDSLSFEEAEELAQKSYLRNQVRAAEVLIIDEVSMLHNFRFDMIDRAVRALRGIPAPFGGMQVILSGDFFQLPPVSRNREYQETVIQFDEEIPQSEFIYNSEAWKNLNPCICYLTEQHRQDDPVYVGILNAIRSGEINKEHKSLLLSRVETKQKGKEPVTKIYPLNMDVDRENDAELGLLVEPVVEYGMSSHGPPPLVTALKKGVLAPEILRLKRGAKVMFVKNNFDAGYANGTTGTVVACSSDGITVQLSSGQEIEVEPATFVVEENGKIKAEVVQYPLRLAWAITVHKSQGLTLSAAHIDLSLPFEPGMGYVALSRVKSLEGLSLSGLNDKAFIVHEEAQKMDALFKQISESCLKEFQTLPKQTILDLQNSFKERAGIHRVKTKKKSTVEVTKELFESGMSVTEIAKERQCTKGTVLEHLESLKEKDPTISFARIREELPATRLQKIVTAFQKTGTQEGGRRPLGPVYELLGGKISYDDLRLARLLL